MIRARGWIVSQESTDWGVSLSARSVLRHLLGSQFFEVRPGRVLGFTVWLGVGTELPNLVSDGDPDGGRSVGGEVRFFPGDAIRQGYLLVPGPQGQAVCAGDACRTMMSQGR